MKFMKQNVISFKYSNLLLMTLVLIFSLEGCVNKLRVEEEIFDKSLNRTMRKIGFFLATLANSPLDKATYQELRDEITVDLQVLKRRALVLQDRSILANLNLINEDFQTITDAYDDNCNGMQNAGMNNGHVLKKKRCEKLKENLVGYGWDTMMKRYENILAYGS